jgi:hypothetical protein
MTEIPRLVISIGGALVVLAFVAGLVIRVVGGLLHRPFWKLGLRLYAGSGAGMATISGLFLLTAPLMLQADAWWLALVLVPAGLLTLGIGAAGLSWIVRYEIPDAAWQQPPRT